VADDTNIVSDVFVHDRQTGTTTRVSVGPGGAQGNGASWVPLMSGDGRWVAFDSMASNLVAGDTNRMWDVFVHDRQTGTTTRVSVASEGAEGSGNTNPYIRPAISGDGRLVAFDSEASNLVIGDTNGLSDVFVHDRQTGTTTRVSEGPGAGQGNGDSRAQAISADGRWVAFASGASNLVTGDTNGAWDVFVRDRGPLACAVALVPTSTSVSAAGAAGTVGVTAPTGCPWTAVSNAPSWVTVTGGSSGTGNGTVSYAVAVNVAGPRTGTVTIGGETFTLDQASGLPPPPTTVPDTYATSFNTPLVVTAPGVLANDTSNGGGAMTAMLVGRPAYGSMMLNTSGAFSYTPNVGFSGADSFTYRAVTSSGGPGNVASVSITVSPSGPTTRVSVTSGGIQAELSSDSPSISADGRWVAFSSAAGNLVPGDTNGVSDVFLHDRQTRTTTRVSVGTAGVQGNGSSWRPAISADGHFVAFSSQASNLVTGDTNNESDVFVHDRQAGTTTRASVGTAVTQANGGNFVAAISANGRWVAFDS
jgi:Tol biopolymer transport system component